MSGTILALDPATTTGCCIARPWMPLSPFTFSIKPPKKVPTLGYYINKIRELVDEFEPDYIAWEESYVRNYTSARLQFGIAGIIQGYAETRKATMFAIHPSSIKKRATGNGRASKDEVVKAAEQAANCRGSITIRNNDEADAFWIWVIAHEQISGDEFRTKDGLSEVVQDVPA